jgi:hypothetical protein
MLRQISEARLVSLEREVVWLRERVALLSDQLRDIYCLTQQSAEDVLALARSTRRARAVWRALEAWSSPYTPAAARAAPRRRARRCATSDVITEEARAIRRAR